MALRKQERRRSSQRDNERMFLDILSELFHKMSGGFKLQYGARVKVYG